VPDETLLDFAYSFPGSVCVALTIPSNVDLYGNYFHETIDVLSHMAKSQSAIELKAMSQRVGIEPMKAMYKWADDLVDAGFGVDIQWKGQQESYPRLFIQKPELTSLKAVMRSTSDEQLEDFSRTGTLQGVDADSHSFHFQYKVSTGKMKDVYGKFADAVSASKPVKVPSRYKAVIRKSTRVFYSTDEEETRHFLVRIESVKPRGKAQKK